MLFQGDHSSARPERSDSCASESLKRERYEVAFGHRRLRAARELGIKVRAVVRSLTDEELVVAQGQENSGRTDLTFIERARFAARLEDRKFSREIIMSALNIDKAALSRLIAVATRIPPEVIDAIGPAPSFGRVRWQELTELVDVDGNRSRSLDIVKVPTFAEMDTDQRVWNAHAAAGKAPACTSGVWASDDGTHAARVSRSGKRLTLMFDDRVAPHFGDFVKERFKRCTLNTKPQIRRLDGGSRPGLIRLEVRVSRNQLEKHGNTK